MLRTRAALGLRPLTAPVILFVPIGVAIGPRGLRLLPEPALAHLDVVIAIALATLGGFIGIAAGREGRSARRLFAASTLEASVTIATVTGALAILFVAWQVPLPLPPWLVALALGISASASAAPHVATGENGARRVAARVADLDDVLPILVGGIALALMREPSPAAAAWLTVQAIGLALATAAAGRALAAQASSDAEERVFTIGTVMLLGGIAEFLSLSALLAGLVAGTFWTVRGGDVLSRISRDIRHIQHPLVVLLLLIAGARIRFSVSLGALALAYVALRALAKVGGGWLVARIGRPWALPSDLGLHLMSPGVIAVAFALNVGQASDAALSILSIVVVGSMASELLALLVRPAEGPP
jgi:hypothetical protein